MHTLLLAIAISALLALDLSGHTELGRVLARVLTGINYAIAAWIGLRFPSPALRLGRFAFPLLFASIALMLFIAASIDLWREVQGLPPSASWSLFLSMIPASWWSCFCMWLVYHDIHQWEEAGRQRAEILNEQMRIAELKTREFARVLHDSVAGTSSSIQFYLDSLPPGEAASPKAVLGLKRLAGMLATEVRLMIRSFEEPLSEGDDWLENCRCYIDSLLSNFGLRVTWDDSSYHQSTSLPLPLDLQWIFRELAHNTVRHADATRFDVSIASHADSHRIDVRDDGQRTQQHALDRKKGSGLRSLSRRVEALGGTTRIVTGEGLGFAVHLSLPSCTKASQHPPEMRRSDLVAFAEST
ncbi:MAG: sensor histidine kinase [Luteolibacter sp.]